VKVSIESIEPAGAELMVHFSSSVGTAAALWKGPAPVPGSTYFVELDCSDVLNLEEGAVALEEPRECLSYSEAPGGTMICGKLILLSDEGTGTFRIGDGLLEVELGEPTSWSVGTHYRFGLTRLTLYDQSY
jgi:hypothetical protein